MSFLSLQLSVAKEMGVTMDCVIGNVLAVAVAVVLAVVVNAFSFGFTNTLREKNSAQGDTVQVLKPSKTKFFNCVNSF